jgi:hypothetical protein
VEKNRERRTAHLAVSRGPECKLMLQTYQRRAARAAVIGASLRSFVYGRKYGTNEGHVDISAGRRHEREMSCVSSCGVGVRAVEDATLSTIKLGPSAASDQSAALHLSTCRRRHQNSTALQLKPHDRYSFVLQNIITCTSPCSTLCDTCSLLLPCRGRTKALGQGSIMLPHLSSNVLQAS